MTIRYPRYLWVILLVVFGVLLNVWWLSTGSKPADLEVKTKKFYIYEWPEEVVDLWPKQYVHHRISIHEHFKENYGAGALMDAASGMYHTHQYSLFTLMYKRLLESSYRTTNAAEASLFFIPYDLGMDATTRRDDGALAQTNCPHYGTVSRLLQESPYFLRSGGVDHFMLHSINQMMVFYANDACARLYKQCYNCTKLSIDTYPPGIFEHLDQRPHLSHNWLSIPFPGNFHFSDAVTRPLWSNAEPGQGSLVGSAALTVAQVAHSRPYALCFVGSVMVTAKQQRRLRALLISTCQQHPRDCLHVPLKSHESHESIFQAADGADTSTGSNAGANPYARAKFCLTPGGDFPTRKGFFDALLSGCVPVTFETSAALTQWPLHWQVPVQAGLSDPRDRERDRRHGGDLHGRKSEESPRVPSFENFASKCTVYIPRDVALRNMSDTFAYLVKLSADSAFMAARHRCIAAVGYQMQYSLPGTSAQAVAGRRDALDVVLHHLLS